MLVGRDTERSAIEGALTTARAGSCAVLVLVGEAGIGKTSLLAYASEHADDFLVLRTTGVRGESDVSFAGLLELVRPVLARIDGLPPPQARALRMALALEAPAEPTDRFAVAAALLSLLAGAAEERGILVLVDDLHWLDRASAEAIAFAARRLADDRAAFLFAIRDGEDVPVDVAALPALWIAGLDRAATEAYAERMHGALAPDVARRVYEVTAGNPLAIREFRDLDGMALAVGAAPVSRLIESVYGQRATALSESVRAAMLLVAADDAIAAPTIELALEALAVPVGALAEAEAAGLLVTTDGRIRFRHPLVRSAVFQGASERERRRAHAALAAALAGTADRQRLVLHRAAAASDPDDDLADDLAQVAETAFSGHAYAAAAAGFQRAAALATPSRKGPHLFAAARARWLAGDAEGAGEHLDSALASCDTPTLRADIQQLRAEVRQQTGHVADALEILISEARSVAPVDGERAAAMLESAARAAMYRGAPATAIAAAEEAARARGSAPEQVMAVALCLAGRYEQAVPLFRATMAATPTDDPRALALASDAAGWLGAYDEAYDFARRAIALARTNGSPVAVAKAAQVSLDQASAAGEWTAAIAYGDEGTAIGRQTGQDLIVFWCQWTLGTVYAHRGDDGAVADTLRSIVALERPLTWGAILDASAAIRGAHRLAGGDPAGAAIEYAVAVDLDAEQVGNLPMPAAFELIEAHVRAGDRRLAEHVLARVVDRAHQPWAVAALHASRGLLATSADGDDEFRAALAICDRDRNVAQAAHARLTYGEWLRRHRRRLDAREQLRLALAAFERMGARPWAALAHQELLASGESHAVRRDGRPVDGLTPQEYRVAALAAEGLANREIAQRLFLSPKTVEAHLHRAFVKLGVDRRGQLASALEDDGARPT